MVAGKTDEIPAVAVVHVARPSESSRLAGILTSNDPSYPAEPLFTSIGSQSEGIFGLGFLPFTTLDRLRHLGLSAILPLDLFRPPPRFSHCRQLPRRPACRCRGCHAPRQAGHRTPDLCQSRTADATNKEVVSIKMKNPASLGTVPHESIQIHKLNGRWTANRSGAGFCN